MPDPIAAASAAALDSLNSSLTSTPAETPTPAAATETPAAVDGQVSGTETPAPTPASTQVNLADDTPITIKVNGQDQVVSLKELREMGMRQSDYTRKTQELATQRKDFEKSIQDAQDREKQYQSFLNDPQRLGQYYQYLMKEMGQQMPQAQAQAAVGQQAQFDPNGLLTGGEAQQLMEARLHQTAQQIQHLETKMQERIEQRVVELETNTKAAKYEADINNVIGDVLKEFPDLDLIDNVSEKLCSEAMKFNPKTFAEAKEAIVNVAKAQAEKLENRFKERLKTTAVQQTKLKDQGIEPPGGAGVQPGPAPKYKIGDPRLTAAVTAALSAGSKK